MLYQVKKELAMSSIQHRMLSRRGFCLCCVAAAGCTATGGWLSPSQAYAEARNIVDLIRDDAASSDDWDTQMLFFVQHGYRVIGIDRRGHGRSSQVSDGHDMDHYAADAAAVVEHLDLRNSVHIGHSTGGGEVTRYIARHGKGRVAKAVLMSAVPPIMVKSPNNPDGLPISVFDDFRKSLAANRAQFYREVASKPFYGFNRPGAKPLDGVIDNWWRQGMMGGAKAHYDGIKAFSETTSLRT